MIRMLKKLIQYVDRKTAGKTDEENNRASGVLKEDWVIYVKRGRR